MDYGVKFDILINEVAASTALSKFSKTVQIEVPKIIQNLNRIAVPLEKIAAQINIINSTKLSLNTAPASAKIKALKAEVKLLQTQLKATGNAVGGIGAGAAVGASGMRGRRGLVAPSARIPQAGVNMSQLRKNLLPNATFAGVGVPLAAMGVTAMAVGGISYLMKESAKFEDTMVAVQNILRSTDKDASTFESRFASMAKNVRQVGIDTKYSSTDVAEATKYLAMAGMNIETIDKSMMPIANLAALSDAPLDKMADVVTNIMTGFKISADSMGAVSDVLASAVTRSNTTVLEMAEGFKFSAGAMSLTGTSFHEGAAALGVLSNAGIKGTVAGTGLRAMFIRMIKPTKKAQETLDRLGISFTKVGDNGKEMFKPIEQIFQEFRDSKASAEDMYTIFDKIAGTPAVNLLENLGKFREMVLASKIAGGTAAYYAAERMKTAVGLTDQIGSKLEDLGLKAYQSIEKYLISLLGDISNFLSTSESEEVFMSFAKNFRVFTETVIDFTKFVYNNWDYLKWLLGGTFVFSKVNAVFTTLVNTFRLFPSVLAPVAAAAGQAATATGGFGMALNSLKAGGIIGLASIAVTNLGLIGYSLWSTGRDADQLYDKLDDPSVDFIALKNAMNALDGVKSSADEASDAVRTLTDKAFEAAPARKGLGWQLFDRVLNVYESGVVGKGFLKTALGIAGPLGGVASGLLGGAEALGADPAKAGRGFMRSMGVYDEALEKSLLYQTNKNAGAYLKDIQKNALGDDKTSAIAAISDLSVKASEWRNKAKTREPFSETSEIASYDKRVGISKEYADTMVKLYESQMELGEVRKMLVSPQKFEVEKGFQELGILGKEGIRAMMKPGTDIPDPGKVVEFMTKASKKQVGSAIIENAVKTFGFAEALKTDITVDKEYQPTIRSLGMEDEFGNLGGGGGSGSGGNYSGTGKMKSQSNRNIIVNIENLLNIETAELLEGRDHIKDILVQTLTDAIKDTEISYQ